jgi:predicted dinucleotide-binding enzyme
MTRIGVIGAGHIGRSFSLAAIAEGYEIVIANNNGPETLRELVRAFNHLDAAAIASDGTPAGTPNRRALGYAGDDPGARKLAADPYDEFGFDPVDVGGLADASRLDVDQPTFVVRQNADELRANLAKATRNTR